MNQFTQLYLSLLQSVVDRGFRHQNTLASTLLTFKLPASVHPILTARKVHYKGALTELQWILNGGTNISALGPYAKYWSTQADTNGYIPLSYGEHFRDYSGYDQLTGFCESIINHPTSRRHQLSLWNPPVALNSEHMPPCLSGLGFICQETPHGYNCSITIKMRSSDLMLGFVFDVFQYHILGRLICNYATMQTRAKYTLTEYAFVADIAHIYNSHLHVANEMISVPKKQPSPPTENIGLYVNPKATPFNFNPDYHIGLGLPKNAPSYHIPLVTKSGPVAQ